MLLPSDIYIENLLRPLQLFYFHLWLIYWLSLVICALHHIIVRLMKLRRIWLTANIARMGESRKTFKVLVRIPEGKSPIRKPRRITLKWMFNEWPVTVWIEFSRLIITAKRGLFWIWHPSLQPPAHAGSSFADFSFFFYPEDGGDTFLRNVRLYYIYTSPHPRRRHSLFIVTCNGEASTTCIAFSSWGWMFMATAERERERERMCVWGGHASDPRSAFVSSWQ
jgi:hypothetical protein